MASSRPSPAVSVVRLTSAQTIPLRHAVLWPDKPPAFVVLPEDDLASTTHLGAVPAVGSSPPLANAPTSQEPISIITLVPDAFPSPGLSHLAALRFRKFATAPAHQGRGVGAQLLAAVFALADGGEPGPVELVWCDARVEQQGWYERRGMRREGGVFDKDGRAYVRMVREPPALVQRGRS